MPNHSGPNTNESGLVFSFDVNDYNSFKGQPGTNLGSGPNFGYAGSGLSEFQNGKLIRWKSVTEKVHIPTLGVKDVNTIEWYNVYSGYGVDGNYTCCPTIFTYSPNGWNSTILEPSTEYMYQIIYKSASGYTHPNYMYHYERSADDSQGTEFGVHSTGRRTHLGDGWYHAWGSFTTQSYTVKGYFGCWHYEYNTKNKVSLAAVSLIKGNTVRPPAQFIDEGTTLGNTEALLDLTGNTTIDLSNVSFDADAQMTFDGTNDYINFAAGTMPNFGTDDFAIEVVFKMLNSTGYSHFYQVGGQYHFGLKMYNNDQRIYVYRDSSLSTYNDIPADANFGVYNHLICQRKGDNLEMYLNGEYKGFKSGWGSVNIDAVTNAARIGNYGGEYSRGEQPLTKIYNRALTEAEALANYNAVKSRFNI